MFKDTYIEAQIESEIHLKKLNSLLSLKIKDRTCLLVDATLTGKNFP